MCFSIVKHHSSISLSLCLCLSLLTFYDILLGFCSLAVCSCSFTCCFDCFNTISSPHLQWLSCPDTSFDMLSICNAGHCSV